MGQPNAQMMPPPDTGGEAEVVASLQVIGLTANRVVYTDSTKTLTSTPDLIYAAGTDDIILAKVTGDTHPRYKLEADGRMEYGSGSSAADVVTYRISTDTWGVRVGSTDVLQVGGVETVVITRPGNALGVVGTGLTVTTGAVTGITAGTSVSALISLGGGNLTWQGGGPTFVRTVSISSPTLAASAPTTVDYAYGLVVSAPSAGANITITTRAAFVAETGGTGYGLWTDGSLGFAVDNAVDLTPITQRPRTIYAGTSVVLASGGLLSWSTDLHLVRDAANVLAQKNATTAQSFRIYGTTTGPKYLRLQHDGTDGEIGSTAGNLILGPDTNTVITFRTNGTARFFGSVNGLYPNGGNAYDLGDATNTWRTIYVGTSVVIGTAEATLTGTNKLNIYAAGPAYALFRDTTNDIEAFCGVSTSGTNSAVFGSATNHPIIFYSNGTARWVVSASGHLLANTNNTYDIGDGSNNPRTIYAGTSVTLASAATLVWSTDLILRRGGANVLQQSNGTNAQASYLYNTTDSDATPANYERGELRWSSNQLQLVTTEGGTGTSRSMVIGPMGASGNLILQTVNTARWYFGTTGHWLAFVDNTYDLGASGASRPRTGYFGTRVICDSATGLQGTEALFSAGTTTKGVRLVNTGGATNSYTYLDLAESVGVAGATLYYLSTTYTTSGRYQAGSCVLETLGGATNGINVVAQAGGIKFWTAGFSTHNWTFNASGHLLAGTDNTYDIGASGASSARDIYAARRFLTAAGSETTPSYTFTAATGLGIFAASSIIRFAHSGAESYQFDVNYFWVKSDSARFVMGSGADVNLYRDAANILAQRNSTTAQEFRVYNTYTNSTNYERLRTYWSTNVAIIGTDALGTGTSRALSIGTLGSAALSFLISGNIAWQVSASSHLLAGTDNSYDIGASGATRPRTVYAGTSVISGDGSVGSPSFALAGQTSTGMWLRGSGVLAFSVGGVEVMELQSSNLVFDQSTAQINWRASALGTQDTTILRGEAGCVRHVNTRTITGAVTDGYTAAIRLSPTYSAATAQTVTRHNYIDVEDVVVSGAGPAAVTDACVFRFNAALGTHKATTALDKTANAKSGTIKVNVNGTIYHIQLYAA